MTITNIVVPAKDGTGASFNLDMGVDSTTTNNIQKVVIADPADGTFYAPTKNVPDMLQFAPASATSAAIIATQDCTGYQGVSVQVTSAGTTCTITYEAGPTSGGVFNAVAGTLFVDGLGVNKVSTSTTANQWVFPVKAKFFQIRVSTYGSGTVTVNYTLLKTLQGYPSGLANVQGFTTVGSTVTDNPTMAGLFARTSDQTTLANAKSSYWTADTRGIPIVRHWAIPESTLSYAAASGGISNTTTAVTIIAAQAAGIRIYLLSLDISCNSGTFTETEIAIRDGAGGTVLWRGVIPASTAAVPMQPKTFPFDVPLRGTAATLMEIVTLTATGSGTKVYVNAKGFLAP